MMGAVAARLGVGYGMADIADDDHLLAVYAIRIPVVCHLPTGRELGWPFTPEQLQQFIMGELR